MPVVTRNQTKRNRLIDQYRMAYENEQEWRRQIRRGLDWKDSYYKDDRMNSLYVLCHAKEKYVEAIHGQKYPKLAQAYQSISRQLGMVTESDPICMVRLLSRLQKIAKENLYGCLDELNL